ncbi:DUF2919 family protein [Thalassotalea mangrovi]|uniref:DUF2919 domain-containing protein n=1 Tax=Thalassotalea mangrovi TaxID=2572245 RepID=A0A4U1B5V0_9GAMM|nr:DUF2919 family protein [Thalassotalea mangrovi]TKB45763.1 DUF2919 domain-containing protein [Thalassotalea mangrovi]
MDKKAVHPYAGYSIRDFDRHQCLKLSWWFYLVMICLNKVYIVAILSFANMQDKLQLIQLVYPVPKTFYLALLVSVPSILFAYLVFFRKPEASTMVRWLWPKMIWLALLILSAEIILLFALSYTLGADISPQLYGQWLVTAIIIVLGGMIPRVRLNLQEFPEQLADNKK